MEAGDTIGDVNVPILIFINIFITDKANRVMTGTWGDVFLPGSSDLSEKSLINADPIDRKEAFVT